MDQKIENHNEQLTQKLQAKLNLLYAKKKPNTKNKDTRKEWTTNELNSTKGTNMKKTKIEANTQKL